MQNLTTTLIEDIKAKREIILPSGQAKFNWVDVENICEMGAILLDRFVEYKNLPFEITGLENENFEKVCSLINKAIKDPIEYRSVNVLRFYGIKRKEGMVKGMIIVMILIHLLPRFQKEPIISDSYKRLTNLAETISENENPWIMLVELK